jgi:hypothetical protein
VGDPLDFAIITALVVSVVQGAGPWIRAALARHARTVRSFGGGVGLAYVFLQLFPEIDNVHEWLGTHAHLVTLVSFLLFYAIEVWLITRARQAAPAAAAGDGDVTTVFWLHAAIMFFYVATVLFTLPDGIADDLLFATVGGLAIGLHLVYKDYILRVALDQRYQAAGRYLLAAAPLLGWLAHRLIDPSDAVLDITMAVLAGILMQGVFRDEIPRPDAAALGWVVAGVGTFALLSIIR